MTIELILLITDKLRKKTNLKINFFKQFQFNYKSIKEKQI